MVIIRIIYGPFNVVFSFYVIVLIHRLSFFFKDRERERETEDVRVVMDMERNPV